MLRSQQPLQLRSLESKPHLNLRITPCPQRQINACRLTCSATLGAHSCSAEHHSSARRQHAAVLQQAQACFLKRPHASALQRTRITHRTGLVITHAVVAVGHAATTAADSAVTTLVATLCRKTLHHTTGLLSAILSWPWWALGLVMLAGMALGFGLSKVFANYVGQVFDPDKTSRENAELRAKVAELQQVLARVEPVAYKSMKLRFTKGINKAVILGMVDTMLANKEVNIWWLPDQLERMIYFNMMTLLLSVLDEVVDGMSISFAGHDVRLQLTHLDVERAGPMSAEAAAAAAAAETQAMIKHALETPSK